MRCLSCNAILHKDTLADPRNELCVECMDFVNQSLTDFDDNDIFDHTIFNETDHE